VQQPLSYQSKEQPEHLGRLQHRRYVCRPSDHKPLVQPTAWKDRLHKPPPVSDPRRPQCAVHTAPRGHLRNASLAAAGHSADGQPIMPCMQTRNTAIGARKPGRSTRLCLSAVGPVQGDLQQPGCCGFECSATMRQVYERDVCMRQNMLRCRAPLLGDLVTAQHDWADRTRRKSRLTAPTHLAHSTMSQSCEAPRQSTEQTSATPRSVQRNRSSSVRKGKEAT